MALATATSEVYTRLALRRTGIGRFFSCVLCCDAFGGTKYEPDIFLACCRSLGAQPRSTWVFEDSLHAVLSARGAGFPVCALEDAESAAQKPQIMAAADCWLESLVHWRALPFAALLSGED